MRDEARTIDEDSRRIEGPKRSYLHRSCRQHRPPRRSHCCPVRPVWRTLPTTRITFSGSRTFTSFDVDGHDRHILTRDIFRAVRS